MTYEVVKRITISVSDGAYEGRLHAADEGSSVSALVTGYLLSLGERPAKSSRLEAQQQEVFEEIDNFSACGRLNRDEVYRRAVR